MLPKRKDDLEDMDLKMLKKIGFLLFLPCLLVAVGTIIGFWIIFR